MQTTSVNGINIAYRIDGDRDRDRDANLPWLVLSNSLAADHLMWDPQMAALTRTRRVLRYDTRGHGETTATSGPYSFDMLVSDLIGLMDSLNIERADILGLSLGGMTALGLALDHPSRVNRLICCDARADAPTAYAEGWHQRITVAQEKGLSAIFEGTIERWLTDSFRTDPGNEDIVALCRSMILSTSVEGFCGCANALTELNYAPRLEEIAAPTLCVVGDEDVAAPPDVMTAMSDAIPNASLVMINSAAHLSNLNNPLAFNKAIEEWW